MSFTEGANVNGASLRDDNLYENPIASIHGIFTIHIN